MSPSELQRQVAEKHVAGYAATGPRIDKVRRLFAGFESGKKILDVGCADGDILSPFARLHEIHAVDISAGLAAKAVQAGLRARVHDLESGPLPFGDKTFDVVFSGENIEHYVDTDWMLSEVNRVLKPGGTFVLTFPNIRTLLSVAMMLFLDLPPMYSARYRSPHYRDFTLRTIKIALKNHGFAVRKSIGCSFYLPRLGECGGWLAGPLPSWANTSIVLSVKQADSAYSPEQCMGELVGS